MTTPILFVDDDVNLLKGMRRALRKRFDLVTAEGGERALETLREAGPFSVIIADMRMPGMDGVELLQRCAKIAPDTVRLMLTGNADQETAVGAINTGHIFRFLNKPCEAEDLAIAIEAAQRQYQLITAEKQLLEYTLAGSVKVLTDVLSMSQPELYGRAMVIKDWSEVIARKMDVPRVWEIGLAAMLSPIGFAAIPTAILEKVSTNQDLTPEETELYEIAPGHAKQLIGNIPRLNDVAEMVEYQNRRFDGVGFPEDGAKGDNIPLGARILFAVSALLDATGGLSPKRHHFTVLKENRDRYDPKVLSAIDACLTELHGDDGLELREVTQAIQSRWLRAGDQLEDDLTTTDGRLVLRAGARLTELEVARVKNFQRLYDFVEPVRVRRIAA